MTLTPMLNQGPIPISSGNCLHAVAGDQITHNMWQIGLSSRRPLAPVGHLGAPRRAKLRTRLNRIENRWFTFPEIAYFGCLY